jgi:SNF family Na+-dependent transporter
MFTNFFLRSLSGVISLSLPRIQAITNFIQSGRASASWIVLIVLVVFGVACCVFVDAVASWKIQQQNIYSILL